MNDLMDRLAKDYGPIPADAIDAMLDARNALRLQAEKVELLERKLAWGNRQPEIAMHHDPSRAGDVYL